jgi:RHS repeat-associated protein
MLCTALAWLGGVLTLAAQAPGKSGVSPSVISLPGGPGAIEGLGPSFEPDLNTGTAPYSVPIAVPPGVAGHDPELALSYNSGSGNSFLGIGWNLDLPRITRQLDKGLPRYTGAVEPAATEDVFLFRGEELVPLSDGTYRCENESEFIRFRKIASVAGGPLDAWEAALPAGGTMIFGASPVERVTRTGGDPASFSDTYCWALSTHSDTSGNQIRYEYQTFTPESSGLLYPSRIEYARFGNNIYHRIEFTYSGSERFPDQRADIFSDFRAGFEIRTSKLLREIAVYTDAQLVRRYVVGYTPDPALEPRGEGADLRFSQVRSVTQFDRSGSDSNYLPPLRFAYTRFNTVSGGTSSGQPEFKAVTGGVNFLRFAPAWTEVVDINSDGLPDFISSAFGSWYAYLNRGNSRFSDEVTFTANSADGTDQANGKRLNEPAITLADLDGDGITDLFQKAAVSQRMLMHRNLNDFRSPSTLDATEVVRWGPEIEFSAELETVQFGSLDISAPSIRMLDLNFDKRTDVIRPFDLGAGTGGIEYVLNLPEGWKSDLVLPPDPRIPADWSPGEARFDSQEPAWRIAGLADLNGDRLEDWFTLAMVGDQVWLDYWPNANGGYWAVRHTTERLTEPGARADEFRLMDVNADGLNDLVLVRHFGLKFWVNTGGDQWSDAVVRTDAPAFIQGFTVLRVLDVNGNGTPDLFWDNSLLDPGSLPDGAPVYAYLDFVGELKPNLLTTIDNGIGLRTFIHYRSSSQDYLEALAEGYPWTTKLPFQVTVVGRTVENIGLDLNADGKVDEYITDLTYRDGYYDSFEKEFRGFAFVQEIERGDDYNPVTGQTGLGTGTVSGPTLVTRHRYLTGAPDGVDNDDYVDGYPGPVASDEGTGTGGPIVSFTDDRGGREEEALKGFAIVQESIDGAILNASPEEAAGFHACARAAALAALTNALAPQAFRCAPDKYVYNRSHMEWKVRRLYRPQGLANPPGRFADGNDPQPVYSLVQKSVSFAHPTTTETEVIEANGLLRHLLDGKPVGYPERPPKVTRSETRYDDYGNSVFSAEYGIVEPDDVSAYDDERITRITYTLDSLALSRWLIRFPATTRVEDESGVFVSETRHFYDGEELVGLPLGQVGARGLLKRTENVITDNPAGLLPLEQYDPVLIGRVGDPRLPAQSFVISSRTAHDVYGNAIVVMDPLGKAADVELLPNGTAPLFAQGMAGNSGHFQVIEYDNERHTHPVAETFVIGDGKATQSTHAAYDPGLGAVTEVVDWNGGKTMFRYDSFGRLVTIIRAGDWEAKPTQRFIYRPGDSQRNLVYNYSDAGTLANGAPANAAPPVANAIETRQREDISESPDYNTLDGVVYSSGSGQALMTLTEDEGRWVVDQAPVFNLRGKEKAACTPYYRADSGYHVPGTGGFRGDGTAVTDTDRLETTVDPVGRIIRILNAPENLDGARSSSLVQNLPFERRDFDPQDSDPASGTFETPGVTLGDGLQRVVEIQETTRLNDDGTPGTVLRTWKTHYGYTLSDSVCRLEDSQGNVTWSRFDGLGRRVLQNHVDGGVTVLTYNEASSVTEKLDARNQRIRYAYDGANRLIAEDYRDEGQSFSSNFSFDPALPLSPTNRPDVAFFYDAPAAIDRGDGVLVQATNTQGRLAYVWDLSGEEHFSYDLRGRAVWAIKRLFDPEFLFRPEPVRLLVNYRTELKHDAMDRLASLTYPDADQIHYNYGRRGFVCSIFGNTNNSIVASVEYVPSGQTERIKYGNGVTTTYRHDPRLRLRELLTGKSDTNVNLIHFAYHWDPVSQMVRISDQRPGSAVPKGDPRRNTQSFAYDDLHRLTQVEYSFGLPGDLASNAEIQYRYDRLGNLRAQNSTLEHVERELVVANLGEMEMGGTSGSWQRIGRKAEDEAGPHALTRIQGTNQMTRTYTYDANGNATTLDGLTNTWDFMDRLVVAENSQMRAQYTYDYQGQRVMKLVIPRSGTANPTNLHRAPETVLYVNRYFEIREHDGVTKYVWNRNNRVARVTGSLNPDFCVQRLRLYPGWNLCSMAVTAARALSQMAVPAASPAVTCVCRWDDENRSWTKVGSEETLTAGTVAWVYAATNAVLSLTGSYLPPSSRFVPGEGTFVACAGVTPWTPGFGGQTGVSSWRYDASVRCWAGSFAAPLDSISESSGVISPGEALFVRGANPIQLQPPGPLLSVCHYHEDHLGSSAIIADAGGNVVQETAFYPFGHPRHQTQFQSVLEPYAFAQKEQDMETGLHYFTARFLSTVTGRMCSVDPLASVVDSSGNSAAQRLNCYAYALNAPLAFVDPTGLDPTFVLGGEKIHSWQLNKGDILLKHRDKGLFSGLIQFVQKLAWLFRKHDGTTSDLTHALIVYNSNAQLDPEKDAVFLHASGDRIKTAGIQDLKSATYDVIRYEDRAMRERAADVAKEDVDRAANTFTYGRYGLRGFLKAVAAPLQRSGFDEKRAERIKAGRGDRSFFCSSFVVHSWTKAFGRNSPIKERPETTPRNLKRVLNQTPGFKH